MSFEQILATLFQKGIDLGGRILFVLIFFFIGAQVIKMVRKIIKKSMEKAKAETGVVQFVDSFVKVSLYVVLGFMMAASFGVDAASIVALLGSAGVAIGLAIQGSLSNLAGGVLILLLKPFVVGDYICESATGKEGVVKEIHIFYTKLATADNKTVILPNGALANTSIVNVTTAKTRRVDVFVGVSYKADLKQTKDVLSQVLEEEPGALKDKEKAVFVDSLGASSVKMCVRCWVASDDYFAVIARVTENCKLALDKAGIEIPYNQLDVNMKGN